MSGFDLSTAKPVADAGFDLSTATPVASNAAPAPTVADPTPAPVQAPSPLTLGEKVVSALPNSVQNWLQHPTLPGVGYIGAGSIPHSYAMGAADPVVGAAQLVANATGSGNVVNQAISNKEKQFQADRNAAGRSGFDVGRFVGNIANPTTLITSGMLPAAPTSLGRAALQGMGTGAAFGAITPVTNPDNFWSQKGDQVRTGAITGGIASPIAYGVSKLLSPTISPDVKTLMDSGVTPTPGQILGGGFKKTEDAMTSIPVLGDFVKNAQGRSMADFNRAALNRSDMNASTGGQEGIAEVTQAFNKGYDNVLSRMSLNPQQQFEQDALSAGIANRVSPQGLDDIKNFISQRYVPKFQNNANGVPTMSGNDIKALDIELRQEASSFLRSQNPMDQRLGAAYTDIRSALRDALSRNNSPSDVEALNTLDKQFANFAQYRNASTTQGAVNHSGMVTPAQYLSSVASSAKKSGRTNLLAQGEALNQDFGTAANNVLGNKFPDSGTPFRHAVQAGMMGLLGHEYIPPGLIAPTVIGTGAGALPYTKIGQRVMAQALTSRPESIQAIGGLLQRAAPLAGLPFLNSALQANP